MANTDDLYKLSFGQHGCSFSDNGSPITPPSGMVIIAIQFLADNNFTALAAEDADNGKSWGLTAGHTGAGSGAGSVVIDSSNKFPAGITIFGRWTSATAAADADGGIVCYFGPK